MKKVLILISLILLAVSLDAATIQIRRDTSARWASFNSVLLSGEQGCETDTGFCTFGDGITAWNSLAYHVISNPIADARQYGAKGDNSTDDTTALLAVAASEKPAYFPTG